MVCNGNNSIDKDGWQMPSVTTCFTVLELEHLDGYVKGRIDYDYACPVCQRVAKKVSDALELGKIAESAKQESI
jgi:hypothetical protein